MIKKLPLFSLALCLSLASNAEEDLNIVFNDILRFPVQGKFLTRPQGFEFTSIGYNTDFLTVYELNTQAKTNTSSDSIEFINADSEPAIIRKEKLEPYNCTKISDNCAGKEFSQFIRTLAYNFNDHLPVNLELQANRPLITNQFLYYWNQTIPGSNFIDAVMQLPNDDKKQLLLFYQLAQKIKTITKENPLYINIETQSLANGLYYCNLADQPREPSKLIVAH